MSVRWRLTATRFSGAALGTTAYIASVTVSGLAVEEITSRAALAGVPSAMGISGTGVGTTLVTLGIAMRGRRPGLMVGYLLGALGSVATVASVVWGSLWLLLALLSIRVVTITRHLRDLAVTGGLTIEIRYGLP